MQLRSFFLTLNLIVTLAIPTYGINESDLTPINEISENTNKTNETIWGANYFAYASTEANDTKLGQAGISSTHLFGFTRKLSPSYSFSLRPVFAIDSAGYRYGENLPSRTKVGESYVALLWKNPLNISETTKTKLTLKAFPSVDPDWQEAKTNGALGGEFEIYHDINPSWKTLYIGRGIGYSQQFKTHKGNPTKKALIENYIGFLKFWGDTVYFAQYAGLKEAHYNEKTSSQDSITELYILDSSLTYAPTYTLEASLGLTYANDRSKFSFTPYRSEELTFYFMLGYTFL